MGRESTEMLNFDRFEVLTFDCYGTLIDWESGIFSAMRPILAAHGKSLPDVQLLELYGDLEASAEAGPYRPYWDILESVAQGIALRLGFSLSPQQALALPNSVQHWRPWPDTVAALTRLRERYRLAIISNIDDDLFASTRPHLGVRWDHVITAQQARCYKPGAAIFRRALETIGTDPARILHVGQSIYHDVIPAQSLGLRTVWVNRPSPRAGVGAVKPAQGRPDLEVPDLKTLADLATPSTARVG
jgi:2-haloacid dehalogenase